MIPNPVNSWWRLLPLPNSLQKEVQQLCNRKTIQHTELNGIWIKPVIHGIKEKTRQKAPFISALIRLEVSKAWHPTGELTRSQ